MREKNITIKISILDEMKTGQHETKLPSRNVHAHFQNTLLNLYNRFFIKTDYLTHHDYDAITHAFIHKSLAHNGSERNTIYE